MDIKAMHSLLPLRNTLKSFSASPSTYLRIHSTAPTKPCTHLHILDSSFNPPTLAHLSLGLTSLQSSPSPHLLLLLATQNADKPAAPAPFEDRLLMLHLFTASFPPTTTIDIAITKHARFLDKSFELAKHYPNAEQTFLTGFDTLIRLLDTKYYPPAHTLEPLDGFFGSNRVRCTLRDGGWGDREKQREYVEAIRRGEREGEGCKREWAERIELVEGAPESVGVSSTAVREAIRSGDSEVLDRYLTKEVKEWVLERSLYA